MAKKAATVQPDVNAKVMDLSDECDELLSDIMSQVGELKKQALNDKAHWGHSGTLSDLRYRLAVLEAELSGSETLRFNLGNL